MTKYIGHRILGVALAIAALFAAQGASADTLRYGGAWVGSYDGGFTIQDTNPYRAPVTVLAGAFRMTDTSGPTLPAGTSFMALCVDIYHWLSSSTTYTLQTGANFYSGAAQSHIVTDLSRLASVVFDGPALNNVRSAAFQLAAWEIVNEHAPLAAGRSANPYSLSNGEFTVTTGDMAARYQATTWLNVVNAGTYGIDQQVSVWRQDIAGSTQDLAVFAPIPEPQTYMMLLAGLGLMGFVARRRRAQILSIGIRA